MDAYTWNGTLATNSTTCLTANTPSTGHFTTFPSQPRIAFPTYESGTLTITNDIEGSYFSPTTGVIELADFAPFYTDVGPLRDCWMAVTSPFIPHWTAQFLTHTSASFESNGDVLTSSAAPAITPPPPAPSSGPSPQLPVGRTFSPPSLPDNSEVSSLSSSSYQLPPTAQSTNPTTPVSKLSLSTNGVPPGSTPQPSTLELGGSAVVTSTGVTNGVSFTNIYTTTVPSTSQLVTSNGTLVAQLYGFVRFLAVMGLSILLCV